ncbi:hypothetical protein F7984_12255 [Pradoshia sp. D12]|uniref:hypothetical protein n=1 Tax=Bacillaceae TaxID=186817 RepID=UPI00112B91D4|nr:MULTISPECIES: hypothetical protein [Bacillaceae]QFK71944.1 hypothetical protein F7984_12255 [Pradoshia sp. D12]TPF71564.1 hypothetical protein FHY44_13945 [Bacillus sp. D12]
MFPQKKQGNIHVISVKNAIESFLREGKVPNEMPTAIKTAEYIIAKYPDITKVISKFEFPNPDAHSDLVLYLSNGDKIKVNLYKVTGRGSIQPKNVGAKSFISKYFFDANLQEKFNMLYDKDYDQYLSELFEYKSGYPIIDINKEELRKIFPINQFDDDINEIRQRFLYSLRENCFSLFQDFCNNYPLLIENGFKTMLMIDDYNIITRIFAKNKITVEEFNPKDALSFKDIKLFKTGNNTLSILCGSISLNLRFKFESGPLSSVKLAIGYRYIRDINKYEEVFHFRNFRTLKMANDILRHMTYVKKENKSNAIGKCNEAFVYLQLLEEFPNTIQDDPEYCLRLLESYAPYVSPEELHNLKLSSVPAVEQIKNIIKTKYPNFMLESVQLVPESYVNDKLDTADLQLNLRYHNTRVTEKLSLKAISKDKKLTLKNPGIGTILGENFFNISKLYNLELNKTVELLKGKFIQNECTHMESLENVSYVLGKLLQSATQEQLRHGIDNIFGKPLVIITVYNDIKAYTHERIPVTGEITVIAQSPSNTQTTLTWENGKYSLSLRVKFSKGQSHGWSSLKLAAEQKIQ